MKLLFNLRHTFLYNILPKKRLLIAFIGFFISSVVISGGSILMYSIVSSTTTYLGESDDVLIITKEGSTTPYTSQLPLDFVEAVKFVPGVVEVCPEVLTAAVYKNKAIYFRGVDTYSFWNFTPYTLIDGVLLDDKDTFNVTIGLNFAKKHKLEVGDFITIYSTKTTSAIELRVKSIIYTGTLLDDELVAPLAIGQFLTFNSFNYITHVRVRIDLLKTTKEKVKSIVSNSYKIKVGVRTFNETQELNATVFVQDLRGQKINTTEIVNSNSMMFELPFRMYEIYAQIGNFKSNKTQILPGIDLEVNLLIPYLERVLNFTILTEEKEPIENAKISLTSEDFDVYSYTDEIVLYSNSKGKAVVTVSNGTYSAVISYKRFNKKISFATQENNEFEITLIKKHPDLQVKFPQNNSIIHGTTLNLSFVSSPGYSIYYYFDGDGSNTYTYYSEYTNLLVPDFILHKFSGEAGEHTLTVYTKNSYYSGNVSEYFNSTIIYFTIIDPPETLEFENVSDMSNLEPNQVLKVNLPFNYSYYTPSYRWDDKEWISMNNNQIVAETTIGLHKLEIKLKTNTKQKSYFYYFSISENNYNFGLYNLSYHKRIKPNSIFKVWFNNLTEPLFYSWDNRSSNNLFEHEYILTTGLSEGSHSLTIGFQKDGLWNNRSYNVIIDASIPNVSLSVTNNSILNSGEFLSVFSNETINNLAFSWDNQKYSLSYGNKIPTPYTNGTHTLSLIGYDLAGNKFSLFYNFIIVNQTTVNLYDFFLSNEYSGLINQTFIELEIYSPPSVSTITYELEGMLNISGNYTEKQLFHLYSGKYNLTIKLFNNSQIIGYRNWSFYVMDGYNKSFISYYDLPQNNDLEDVVIYFPEFDVSYKLDESSTIFITDNIWSSIILSNNSTNNLFSYLFVDTQPPSVSILSPDKGSDLANIWLDLKTEAVEVFYKIDSLTTFTKYYSPVVISNLSIGEHKLYLTLYDSLKNKKELTYTFSIGIEYSLVNLTFVYSEIGNITLAPNYEFKVRSIWNKTLISLQSNNNGTSLFKILKGQFYLYITYDNTTFVFTINAISNIKKTIFLGKTNLTLSFIDVYANLPISHQYFNIYDYTGLLIKRLKTNSTGETEVSLDTGIYSVEYEVLDNIYSFYIYVFEGTQSYTFYVPSQPEAISLTFIFSNNTQAKNLPIIVETEFFGNISFYTDINGEYILLLPYQKIVIHVFSPSGRRLISLTRYIEPGISSLKIVIPSEKSSTYQELPFQNIGGSFEILVSLSSEYMEHYLKGSLLFTYTLAYAEIILIVLIVSANLYAILRNINTESRKEIRIAEMIGATHSHIMFSIFSRLVILTSFSYIIGYFVGNEILKLLAMKNKTVFFGHTFIPKGNLYIFVICYFLILIIVSVTTLFLVVLHRKNEKNRKEKHKL
ncbi:MAG: ABC transporter permease [Candidatus Heimdallarchaeum aukensis]|uniref:ABC transporter permease n=1 Tax=Candidatus Heimdallarchaeum aukensis TaxID=2876573 RepID=A0A9Y1FL65_9ARCH|nr:MAG: ABC transporter permease [Candidatus Heimdallarchaeum aukensis]